MRKVFLLLTALLAAEIASAKDHVIVIKHNGTSVTSNTEVKTEGDADDETITITPDIDATTITVDIKDLSGATVSHAVVLASENAIYTISSPTLPNGYYLEVRDDKGWLYSTYAL